jgi:hypothetical protein
MATIIEIKDKLADVTPFIQTIQASADSYRAALGFLPTPAYEAAAQEGKLLVAVTSASGPSSVRGPAVCRARLLQFEPQPQLAGEGNAGPVLRIERG